MERMSDELLAKFLDDLAHITDGTLPAWLVDGAKFCAETLAAERHQAWINRMRDDRRWRSPSQA